MKFAALLAIWRREAAVLSQQKTVSNSGNGNQQLGI